MQITKQDTPEAREEKKKMKKCVHIKTSTDPYIKISDFLFVSLSVRRRKCNIVVLSPSDDMYYHWLMVIGVAVFYNWTLLVVR